MRIVIIATGSWGDVRPNVVLGQALQKAGYEVLLVAAEAFRKWVEARGVVFSGLSFDMLAMLDGQAKSAGPWQKLHLMREMTQTTLQMGREIADTVREGDAVLLNEGVLGLVNGVLEKRKVRFIHINLQPWVPTSEFSGMAPLPPAWLPIKKATYNRWSGALVRRGQWLAMGKIGNRLRTDYLGMSKQTWVKHHAMLDSTPSLLLVSPQVLQPPADWQPQHRITGYIFDDDKEWEPPQNLLDFMADGEAPVFIGFGSMRERKPEDTTRLFLDAVNQTGKRAILLSGWAGIGMSNLPKNVFLLNYAPQSWLFPHMAAVVHHGGAGTTAAGLRAGVPSVVVPFMSDQPFWGQRVHQLGAGAEPISRPKLTASNLAAAILEATTNPSMREKAAELGAKITAEDGTNQAVSAVRELLG